MEHNFSAWYVVWPLYVCASLFALFFICAVNQVKPSFANKSTPLRVFYILFVAGFCILTVLTASPQDDYRRYSRSGFLEFYSISILVIMTLSTLLATENPFISVRVAADLNRLQGSLRWRRILYPGSHMGVVFCVVVNALLLALSIGLVRISLDEPTFPYEGRFLDFAWNAAATLVFVASVSAFSYFLSTLFQDRVRVTRVLWGFYILIMLLVPFIYSFIDGMKMKHYARQGLSLPFFVCTSPIPFYESRYYVDMYLAHFILIHLILAVIFMFFGIRRERRLNRERTSMLVRGILEAPSGLS